MNTIQEKFCPRCQQTKSVSDFSKNAKLKDGFQFYCRSCMSEISKAYTLSGKGNEAAKARYRKDREKPEFRARRAGYSRQRTVLCRDSGLCRACGKASRPNRSFCEVCFERKKTQVKERELSFRENGLCMRCGKKPPLPSNVKKKRPFCETCYIRNLSGVTLKTPKHWKILHEKLLQQNYRCIYTGRTLTLGLNASLDHILPVSRFPESISDPHNIQWVDLQINRIKRDLTHVEFLEVIKEITSFVG